MPKRNFSGSASDIMAVFVVLVLPFLMSNSMAFTIADHPPITKPGCREKCGGVSIPYPFGIGSNCSLMQSFNVSCDMINGTYMPFVTMYDDDNDVYVGVGVLNISLLSGQMRVNNTVSSLCYINSTANGTDEDDWSLSLPDNLYFNNEKNKFMVLGCNTLGFLDLDGNKTGDNPVGCFSGCDDQNSLTNGSCSGTGCCQIAIPSATSIYDTYFDTSYNNSSVYNFSRCGYAILMEESEFEFDTRFVTTRDLYRANMSVVVDWSAGNQTCREAEFNKSSYACISENSICVDLSNGAPGYLCNCSSGYQGNPYLLGGCQDIDECAESLCHENTGICENIPGSYRCSCPAGTHNISYGNSGTCEKNQSLALWIKLLIGILLGLVVLLLCFSSVYMARQQRKLTKIKEKHFQQYGGRLLLDEMRSRSRHGHNSFMIFSEEELKEVTKGFDETNVLGQGGNGTVYKGTLKNNEVVAIKRCKTIDERQKKEFGKEILILSQINHKNIVRILGCCLEVEIPILVYEYIQNGTLFDLIHKKGAMRFLLSTRLRIASEAAHALAYLHTWVNPPIVHRDVKSSNILLDENFMAKVSDFGASILAPTDEDQFVTMVQGTRGYLDPEYLRSGQLTVKSDVYSFGVVLLELLTGKKALYFDGPEENRSLSSRFLSLMKENKLEEILDSEIMNDENMDLIKEVAKLAKSCLRMEGENRPEMKQVAEELDRARKCMKHSWGEENLEERKSLLARGELSKSHEMEMTGHYSSDTISMLGSGQGDDF